MLSFLSLPTSPHLLIRVFNALLKQEDWARDRLARHVGKTVRFVSGKRTLSLAIISDEQLAIATAATVPDLTFTVQFERLNPLRLLAGERPDLAEFTHLLGDAALAQVVGELVRTLRWDLEDVLAKVVGDVLAARLVSGARTLTRDACTASGRLATNMAEYLSEESFILAGKPLLTQQQLDIDQLRGDLDALVRQTDTLHAALARTALVYRAATTQRGV